VPQKCTLFGTYEQMGPARLADSRRFWALESKGKEDSDRRCAVALVKKHAFAWHLRPKLSFEWVSVQFEEMNEIAGGENRYYAMLAMDGDDMGKWLSGEKSPRVREILHPEILAWYEQQAARRAGLDVRRPVSPSLHASISAALTRFAVKVAPEIVEKHGGKLIYAGGDDLLAALPLEGALPCALALRNHFRSAEAMGSRAGMSAGLAVAHAKEDLRYVLAAARRAERQAKRGGKDRLTLAVLRRSGEHAFAGCAWGYVGALDSQVERFRKGASDRWTYQMRRQLDVLKGLDEAAFEAELGRLIKHGEKPDLGFLEDFREFRILCEKADPREAFIGLCQSASFLARGKEER
jgi:CRISPR-associated protein Cmr2